MICDYYEGKETTETMQSPQIAQSFDRVHSYSEARSFVEKWVAKSNNTVEEFVEVFPGVLERGLLIRKILLEQNKGKKEENKAGKDEGVTTESPRIYSSNLYADESDYSYYFTINMLCACSFNSMPEDIAPAILNYIAQLMKEGKIAEKTAYSEDVVQRLGSVRAELVEETKRVFGIDKQMDDFLKLANKYLAEKKYQEATNIIVNLDFLKDFDLKALCINLAQTGKMNLIKKILDKLPELITTIIKTLSTRDNVKTANKLVKDYKLNAADFPEMQEIQHASAVNYYVSSIFRA